MSIFKTLAATAIALTLTTAAMRGQASSGSLGLSESASVSAMAVRVRDGKVLAKHDAQRRLTPASLTKAFTTGMAMRELGPAARLATVFGLRRHDGGSDIVVHGSFDPTIGSRYFGGVNLSVLADSVVERLHAAGVERIENLEIDLSLSPVQTYGGCRLWEDIGNGYGAIPSVVMDADNEVSLYFNTSVAEGGECSLDSIVPAIESDLRPRVDVTAYSGNQDKSNVFIADSALWLVTGQLPVGRKAFGVKAVVPSPELTFARRLARQLEARGVKTSRVRTAESPAKDSTIFVHYSPTIAEIAKQTNTHSLNHFADALTLHVSTHGGQQRASWDVAGSELAKYWKSNAAINPLFRDGSGLAPYNAVSASDVVAMLKTMKKSREWAEYKATLPRLGIEGTWSGLGRNTAIAGKVRAKSGSMTGVVSYGGVLTLANGDEVLFAVIVNHFEESPYDVKKRIVQWLLNIYKTHHQ